MSVASYVCVDTKSRFGDLLWVEFRYTFDDASTTTIGPLKVASLAEGEALCASWVPKAERYVLDESYTVATKWLRKGHPGQNAQDVIPSYPDELPASDADVSVDTRQRRFHRWLVRWVWPLELQPHARWEYRLQTVMQTID